MDYSRIAAVAGKYGSKLYYDKPIAEYTSFHIGGKCDVVVMPGSAECISDIIGECRKYGIKYYFFGKCTNVLIPDEGLRGVVILLGNDFSGIRREEKCLICEAGTSMTKVCSFARDEGLSGLEFAFGIPGSVGGALYMNAGAFGGEMNDVVKYCDYLDTDGSVKRVYKDSMELSYRHSIFTGSDKIILSVCLELTKGDVKEISDKMNDIMNRRRDKQPLEYPSAGSTFKRPEGYFAGKLIEESGLKGYTCGGAQVSEKHSGFVINKGGATSSDVRRLIKKIQDKVFADSGVELECEVLIVE